MNLNESVRFVLTKQDKQILSELAKQDGQASMSAVIRRLIQLEAKERGIEVGSQPAVSNQSDN